MIKLAEIIANPGHYDPETGKNTVSYRLRDVFVNPAHVVTMREDEEYNSRRNSGTLVPGLNENVSFTRLSLNVGGNVTLKCTVAGDPQSILQKLTNKSA